MYVLIHNLIVIMLSSSLAWMFHVVN
jgi:hypothetical protein